MKKGLQKILMISCIFLSVNKLNAQKDTAFSTLLDSINLDDLFGKVPTKKSYFKLSASYLSNYVYGGRKDTVAYPYLTTTLEYNHKSGMYASAAFSFLTNKNSRLDVTSLEIGYAIDTLIKNISGSVYLGRSFYNNSSSNVQNDVKWNLGASFQYESKICNISVMPFLMLGTNKDFALAMAIEHPFYFENKKQTHAFTISPTIAVTMGNTGFYQADTRKKKGPLQGFSRTITSPTKFQLLSYDLSLPMSFDKETWGCFFNPTYTLAQNPVQYNFRYFNANGNEIFPPNQPKTLKEDIGNTFFAEMGVYFRF